MLPRSEWTLGTQSRMSKILRRLSILFKRPEDMACILATHGTCPIVNYAIITSMRHLANMFRQLTVCAARRLMLSQVKNGCWMVAMQLFDQSGVVTDTF